MHRRQFLTAATTATTVALANGLSATANAGLLSGRIRKAVKFHMVREDLPVAEKLRLLKDIGFDGVEVRTNERLDFSELAKAANRLDFPVHGVVNSSDPDLESAIKLAARLGSRSVLIVIPPDKQYSNAEQAKRWQLRIRQVEKQAEQNKVHLLIENVRKSFLKTAEGMAEFIDKCESPWVGAYFDTGNTITWTTQTAQHWVRVLGKRIVKLDIKDRGHSQFGDAKLRSRSAVGTDGGEVHWKAVRNQLDANKFSGWATAEVAGGDRLHLTRMAKWMDNVLDCRKVSR